MRSALGLLGILVLLAPSQAAAQELDVTRRTYTFVDSRLDVAVLAEAPGVLQVVRGTAGQVEVAARSTAGFAGFGLGGRITPELRLTAVGSEGVQYIVVVPERVSVRVRLPEGRSATLGATQPAGTYRWGAAATGAPENGGGPAASAARNGAATSAAILGGMPVAHRADRAPGVIDIPDLASVRSVTVRFEGSEFVVAASRPLVVHPGNRQQLDMRIDGDPLDLMIQVPSGTAPFLLRTGNVRIAEYIGGQPQAVCDNVVIQRQGSDRTWFSFFPQGGRLDCR